MTSRGRRLDEIGTAVARGAYTEQLRRVFEAYGRDQVLVLQYERCRADPVSEIERTIRFLGLEPPPEGPREPPEGTREPRSKPPLPEPLRLDLVARLHDDVQRLICLCPEIDLALWPNFSESVAGAGAEGA
jgi:Sulfotransferase domain